jgi:hypothetical protein
VRPIVGPFLLLSACSIEPAEEFGDLEERVGAVEGAIEGEQTCDCALTDVERDLLKAEIMAEVLSSLGVAPGTQVATADDLDALDARVGALEASGADAATEARLAEIERFSAPYLDGASTVAGLVGDMDGRLGASEADIALLGAGLVDVQDFLVGHLGVGETLDDVTVAPTELNDYVRLDSFVASLSAFADAADVADLEGRVTTVESDLLALDASVDALVSDVATQGADAVALSAEMAVLETEVDAEAADQDAMDARLAAVEADYLTSADAGDIDLSSYVTAVDLAVALDAYVSDVDFAVTLDAYALDTDLTSLNSGLSDLNLRTAAIEGDYLTSSDLVGLVTDVALGDVASQLAGMDSRLATVEFDYITLSELSSTLAVYALDTDLVPLQSSISSVSARVNAIEADYMTSGEVTAALVPLDS